MADPFLINGPALISFSGGRASAYMLYRILQAHDGELPDSTIVAFANTGDEREETLRFVHECASRWNVRVRWIEWRDQPGGYEEVGFNSASRTGAPFDALINKKKRLPNWQERWCTQHLKVLPLFSLMRTLTGLEPGQYAEVIGLRDDEGFRILKGMSRAADHGRRVSYPLAKSKITAADVWRFWLGENANPLALTHPLPQGFDLGLPRHWGNCTLCFATGRDVRKARIRDMPEVATRWIAREDRVKGSFDRRDSVAGLVAEVRRQPDFFAQDDEERDAACDLHCATGEDDG